jgi:hypothetical protein
MENTSSDSDPADIPADVAIMVQLMAALNPELLVEKINHELQESMRKFHAVCALADLGSPRSVICVNRKDKDTGERERGYTIGCVLYVPDVRPTPETQEFCKQLQATLAGHLVDVNPKLAASNCATLAEFERDHD